MNEEFTDEEYSTDEETTLRSGRVLINRVRKTRRVRRVMTGSGSAPPAPPVVKKKGLSQWGITGLDITNPAFSKLHGKEQRFEDDRK